MQNNFSLQQTRAFTLNGFLQANQCVKYDAEVTVELYGQYLSGNTFMVSENGR